MLIEATEDDFHAISSGIVRPGLYIAADTVIAPPGVLDMLANLAADVRQQFLPSAWWIVDDREVVGLCSILRVPQDGDVHIGYGVAPSRQGRGFASRAVNQALDWAKHDPRVSVVSAETSTKNIASQRVLERNGFRPVAERVDKDDGPVICWRVVVK